jgi:hypothetical protein
MGDAMKYFVEVISDAITDEQAAAARLAETLKLDPAKALALLRRNPVTKPVSQPEAEKVAKLFRRAGIEVFIRTDTPEIEVKNVPPIPSPEVKAPAPSWPEPKVSSPTLPDISDVEISSPSWPDAKISSPSLPDVKVSSSTWPDVKISSPNWPDVKISNSDLDMPGVNMPGVNIPSVNMSSPNLSATPIQEDALKLPSSFFGGPSEDAPRNVVPFESKYPTLPPVSEAPIVTSESVTGGVGQFLLASLLPGFLAVAGIGAMLYFLGLPFLRNQQSIAIQNAASTLASSISGWIGNTPFNDPALQQQFQTTIARTQPTLRQNNIDFVLLSDAQGKQIAGWYQDLPTPGVPENFINAVLPEITRTLTEATSPNLATQQQLIIDGNLTNVSSQAVRQQDTPVGVITVGMQEKTLLEKIRQPSMITLVSGLIPLILSSLLLSLILGRKRS